MCYSRQLLVQYILTEQFSIQHCNISANEFSSVWKGNDTSENVTLLPLQLTLNIFNTLIHFSNKTCATNAQIGSTIYHSFSSCQPLAATQNLSPTTTGNPIHDLYGILTSKTGTSQVLVSKNTKQNLN